MYVYFIREKMNLSLHREQTEREKEDDNNNNNDFHDI